eukprot:CAMPEP_0169176114 /NCGR_PEP_ID=MMETSP1015-20121227/65656_1 /TAXON_ID=342587 /ORGANISM="Karlodinium micrum, Strain CCMP2283" /LENGTH=364 /DNA_ID=CAMNT_0009250517 /DNA_START=157 /DNA_END=1251 /DNA_ORIENTATION=+
MTRERFQWETLARDQIQSDRHDQQMRDFGSSMLLADSSEWAGKQTSHRSFDRLAQVLLAFNPVADNLAQTIRSGSPTVARHHDSNQRTGRVAMSADRPSIIIGGGRIGSMLASLGGDGDVVVRRGDPFPSSPETGPIYVTTRNDDLAGVIEMTPEHRRKDLVFMQNGMLGKFLEEKGLSDNTQVLLYLAVAKLGEEPTDGITDLNPEGLTAATGEWAAAFADRLKKGNLKCRLLDGDLYKQAMLEKHVWICAFMLVGANNGGITVGEVAANHANQLKPLIDELCAAGEKALGVKLPEGAYDRLVAYAQIVSHFPTAVKEIEWRNGWFMDIAQAAQEKGEPDPIRLHTFYLSRVLNAEANKWQPQ